MAIAAKKRGEKKTAYPSRIAVKYVALPLAMHAQLEAYAAARSDEDTKRSVSWAARVLIRSGLAYADPAPDRPGT